METRKLTVKIELSEETAEEFGAYIKDKCLDRDNWLKKILADSITGFLKKRKEALARIAHASAGR
jgi:hypothetical protein